MENTQILEIMEARKNKVREQWLVTKSLLGFAQQTYSKEPNAKNKKALSSWKKREKEAYENYSSVMMFVLHVETELKGGK
jgi:hypothetical protein